MPRSFLAQSFPEPERVLPPFVSLSTPHKATEVKTESLNEAPRQAAWLEAVVLPEQFATTGRSVMERTGEYRLLVAILQDACATWFRYRHARRSRESRLFQEVSEWFAEKRSTWPFAFECICDYLGLDPDYIRQGLVQWQPASPGQRSPRFQMTPAIRNRERVAYDELCD
jgi:hypothetical protein